MSFKVGKTTFGFTMRVPARCEIEVNDLFSSHAEWISETHSLEPKIGKLQKLEYVVSKAPELNGVMDP